MAPEEGTEPQASPERPRRGTPCGLTLMAAGLLKGDMENGNGLE